MTIPSDPAVIVMSNILGNLAAVMYVRSSEPNTRNVLLIKNVTSVTKDVTYICNS